jgi:hypothetical protein
VKKYLILLAFFLVFQLAPAVLAEYDPPGPPAVEVRVWIVNFYPLEDMDDGINGETEIQIDYIVFPKPGISRQTGLIDSFYFTFDYDKITGRGKFYSNGEEVKYLLYKTRECWPISPFNLEFDVKEVDFRDSEQLGKTSIEVTKTGYRTLLIPGKIGFRIYVEAVPLKEYSEKCSYFFDQPDTKSSSIVTKSGANIYDFELANMLKMWIGEKGFANMLIVFQQCFGGGMADDILDKLNGDIAILSAAKHDEVAYGYPNATDYAKQKLNPYTREVLEGLKKGDKSKDIARNAEKEDEFSPYGTKSYSKSVRRSSEHPQYASEGKGDEIKLGKKTDGSDVRSKHAIVFGGYNNKQRHWKNIEEFIKLLKSKGFTDEDIIVLADSGKSSGKPYVDGAGTKQALWNALKNLSSKMNKDEQLVIYVTDHGNLETADKALRIVKNDSVKQPVPPKTEDVKKGDKWVLDDNFLRILNLTDENLPYISLIIEPPEEIMLDEEKALEFLSYLILYLNGEELGVEHIEPVYALDTNPDLDGYEVIFPVYDESLLMEENLIELAFEDPELFEPFTIEVVLISTGAMPDLIPENETSAAVPPDLAELSELSELSNIPEEMIPVFDISNKTLKLSEDINLSEEEITALLSGSDLFTLMVEKKNWYNNNTHLVPGFIKNLVGNARINLDVEMKDGSVMKVYIVTENTYITEFEKGTLNDATAKAKTNEEVVRRIVASDNPVQEVQNAMKSGEISYNGVGFVENLKVEIVKVIVRIYFFISDLVG